MLVTFTCKAQTLVNVMDQSFTVHSAGNVFVNTNSSSRNVIEVQLPAKATGYIYRVASSKRGSGQGSSLSELLKGSGTSQLRMEASLAQYVVSQTDGQAVDIFAFDNTDDANSFLRKQDNNWQCCWRNLRVINICFATAKCLNPVLYFGFRNNNPATPINVHLEVVALVDNN